VIFAFRLERLSGPVRPGWTGHAPSKLPRRVVALGNKTRTMRACCCGAADPAASSSMAGAARAPPALRPLPWSRKGPEVDVWPTCRSSICTTCFQKLW
jgi:hypothetical protein